MSLIPLSPVQVFLKRAVERIQAIDRWWFGWGSPLPLGLLRAGVGLAATLNILLLLMYLDTWYFESGLTPSRYGEMWTGGMMLNLLRGATDESAIRGFFFVTLVAAVAMTLGLFSRFSTVVTLLGTMTIQHRNPFLLQGADLALRIVLVYLSFARTGAAFSLDRLLKRRRGMPEEPYASIPLWPQRLIQYQTCIIYFSTVCLKIMTVPWRDGTAVYYTMRLRGYERFHLPTVLTLPPFTNLATYGTLLIESALALTLIFPKIRKYAVIGGLALHFGIFVTMNVPLFSELFMLFYISFFSGEEITAFFAAIPRSFSDWKAKFFEWGRRSVLALYAHRNRV